LFIALFCLCLLGCQSAPQGADFERRLQTQVKAGMGRDRVMDILGVPQIMAPPGFGRSPDEIWQYIVPGVSCELTFSPDGKLKNWRYNATAAVGLGTAYAAPEPACSPEAAREISEQLRALRMDNSVYRAGLPYPLNEYVSRDIDPATMSAADARQLSDAIGAYRQQLRAQSGGAKP